jgi:hypothetical protein
VDVVCLAVLEGQGQVVPGALEKHRQQLALVAAVLALPAAALWISKALTHSHHMQGAVSVHHRTAPHLNARSSNMMLSSLRWCHHRAWVASASQSAMNPRCCQMIASVRPATQAGQGRHTRR